MALKENAPVSLVDVAYRRIREDLAKGYLTPGEKLNVRVLSERYEVSDTPVKQALNRLMVEGVVESIPRKGMKVKRITWSEIEEILEFRIMMERFYAPKVITLLPNDVQLQKAFDQNLTENLRLAQSYGTVDEHQAVYRLDQEFHRMYLVCGGSRKALQVFDNLNSHSYATYLFNRQPKEKTISGVMEHRAVFEAILAGNLNRLLELLDLHNKNAREIIYLTLKINNRIV